MNLNNYADQEIDQILKDNGAFFAFGQQQFEEKRNPEIKYVQIGSGLIAPKDKADTILNEIAAAYEKAARKMVEKYGAEKIIEYQYFNHECQITYDISEARAALDIFVRLFPEQFNDDFIEQVFQKCFQKAVENDFF